MEDFRTLSIPGGVLLVAELRLIGLRACRVAVLGMVNALLMHLLAGLLDAGGAAGVLSQSEGAVGENAEDQGRDRGEGQADACRDADGAALGDVGAVGGGAGVDGREQAEVVEAGYAAVEQADDREPDVAGVDGGGEDVELAEEASGEGDSDEREEEEGEERGEDGALEGEAGVVVGGAGGLVVAGDLGDDGEGSDVHGGVGGGVEAGRGDAVLGEGGEGHEEVAGVGDAGVGQHALDVALEKSSEVADGHRQGGEDPHEDGPAVLHRGEGGEGDAEQDGEGGRLGGGRHEADYGGGGSLVDIGCPYVEGGGGDLEAEADDDEGEGGESELRGCGGGHAVGDRIDGCRPGGSEGQGDAVEEEGGGEGAEEEVLDGGLGAGGLALAEAGHDVGGDGGYLEADEDHQQLDGAGHQHHAGGSEEGEGEVLAGVGGVALEVVERAEEGGEDDRGDKDVEETREGVDLDGVVEGVEGAELELVPAGESCCCCAYDGEPAERLAGVGGGQEGLGQHDEDAGEGEDVLGEEGEDVGR